MTGAGNSRSRARRWYGPVPERMCVACGRVGKRGFTKCGGFWLDRLGDWYRARFLEVFWVCEARMACMKRIYSRRYDEFSFGEQVNPFLDTADAMREAIAASNQRHEDELARLRSLREKRTAVS